MFWRKSMNSNKGRKDMQVDALNATIVEYKNKERLRMKINLMLGDCLERMKEISDRSVDMY